MAERTVTLSSLLERAAAANRSGDLARAEWLCSAILTARPDHCGALHLRAVVAHRSGRTEEALDHVDRAIALGLSSAEAYGNRGTMLCALARFSDALASFDQALSIGPATAEVHCNRGLALYELGRFGEALISYDNALSLRADFAPTHVGLASVLCALGRYREAVDHEAEGLALRTDWNSRMDRLITEERHAEAVALLEEAMPAASRHRPGDFRPQPVARRDVPIRRVVVDCGHHLMHQADAVDLSEACGLPVQLVDLSTAALADFGPATDTLVIYSHGIRMATASPLRAIKEAAPSCPVVTWHLANHTAYLANALLAASADIAFPAHVTPVDYLARWTRGPLGPVMPLALFQWSRPTLTHLYRECRGETRTDALSGHFSLYALASRRNRLLAEAIEEWPDADLSLRRGWSYHARSPLERFLSWRRRKVSLTLPVCGDLSMRFFDALAAGQVPIVPRDIPDFDRVVPPADQASLPIIRLENYDVAALRAAHATAIAAFDSGGEAAAEARHHYVLRRHMLAHRIGDIVAHVDRTTASERP